MTALVLMMMESLAVAVVNLLNGGGIVDVDRVDRNNGGVGCVMVGWLLWRRVAWLWQGWSLWRSVS